MTPTRMWTTISASRRRARGGLEALAIVGLVACSTERKETGTPNSTSPAAPTAIDSAKTAEVTEKQPPSEVVDKTLVIERIQGGIRSRIGKLTFDGAKVTLELVATGKEAERLEKAWEETSKLESLPLAREEVVDEGGTKVRKHKSKLIKKGDARYPNAVWSYLESRHGYLVDVEH